MLDSLSDKLQGVFRRLGGRGTITEKDLDEALREVRLALLEADVNYKVVKDFVAGVRERALGADVTSSLTPMQAIIDIVNLQLIEVLGGGFAKLEKARTPPTVIMLVGLKGGGKTTTTAKLALHLRRGNDKPFMIGLDTGRVAAAEQLQSLSKQLTIPAYTIPEGQTPEKGAKAGLAEAKDAGATAVVVDTTGYVQVDADGTKELQKLHSAIGPTEVLLVADSMTGQEAVNAAAAFHEAVPLTGLILTKLDGDARGGAALSIRAVTGIPIKFVGMGEKADALEPFYPDRFASRLLGMGDMLTLIEKAKEDLSDEDVEGITARMKKGQLTLDDFLEQYQRIKKMGPINQLLGMLPGMGQIKKQLNVDEMDESFFSQVEAIITSMTKAERTNPDIIDGSRRKRIAQGSGTKPADVNRVLNQYREAKKIIQQISSGRGPNITQFLR